MQRSQHNLARGRLPSRIAIGGIWHETNTFSSVPTGLDAFRDRSLLTGDAILAQSAGTAGVLGGVLAAAADAGTDLVPTVFAAAMPGGLVTAEAHHVLRERLLDRLRAPNRGPWPLAAVVLALHGAMVAADEPDVEGALLRDVRRAVGTDVPIVAVLDFHANLSPLMVRHADLVLGYATYPHVDTFEKGRRAVELALDIRAGLLRPETALRQLPLLVPLAAGRTDGPTPMRDILDIAAGFEREAGVASVTVTGGFPYADVARTGLGIAVTTHADATLAARVADNLDAVIWGRRDRFVVPDRSPADAVHDAITFGAGAEREGPVVLADTADNPGAGAPGDATLILRELLERRAEGAVVATIADPAAVAVAGDAAVGSTVSLAVGGKTHTGGGAPVERDWTVRWSGDGAFVNSGPMGRGGITRLGRTVTLAADGVEVIVCERRTQVLDPALFPAAGIDPAARRLLAIKSSVHYRAAFAELASTMIEAGGPGLSGPDLTEFPYAAIRRPMAPLDQDGFDRD
ncbi:MAG: M81 family metallopeptidase [Chloroflexia bacterium]|nr:M81 family metallopeptidase [Chloroflexia bacterium]